MRFQKMVAMSSIVNKFTASKPDRKEISINENVGSIKQDFQMFNWTEFRSFKKNIALT